MKDVFEFIVIRFLEICCFWGGGLLMKMILEKVKFVMIYIVEIEVFLLYLFVFFVIF